MISAQTPLAFVARENRLPLFRIVLQKTLKTPTDAEFAEHYRRTSTICAVALFFLTVPLGHRQATRCAMSTQGLRLSCERWVNEVLTQREGGDPRRPRFG